MSNERAIEVNYIDIQVLIISSTRRSINSLFEDISLKIKQREAVSKLNCTHKLDNKLLECSLLMKHSAKEKLKLIYRIQSGEPLKRIAKETGLGQAYLSVLYDRYKKYGKKGLERKVNRYHSPKEKEFMIRLHEEKGVSLRQI